VSTGTAFFFDVRVARDIAFFSEPARLGALSISMWPSLNKPISILSMSARWPMTWE